MRPRCSGASTTMAKKSRGPQAADRNRKIENYTQPGKERTNNPPVGLVTPGTERDAGKNIYAYAPHLDPTLQWAGRSERMSFEVPTVSLHVHERIDPRSIIEAMRRKNVENTEKHRIKRRFLDEWVRAVNNHGGFGAWSWAVSKNPADIKGILARHAASKV